MFSRSALLLPLPFGQLRRRFFAPDAHWAATVSSGGVEMSFGGAHRLVTERRLLVPVAWPRGSGETSFPGLAGHLELEARGTAGIEVALAVSCDMTHSRLVDQVSPAGALVALHDLVSDLARLACLTLTSRAADVAEPKSRREPASRLR